MHKNVRISGQTASADNITYILNVLYLDFFEVTHNFWTQSLPFALFVF